MNGDAPQLFQVNLNSFELFQCSAKPMAAIDRQEFEAVIITILDLNLLLEKYKARQNGSKILTIFGMSSSSPACTTNSISGGAT